MRRLAVIACALALSGCWVLDELDAGLEQPKAPQQASEEAADVEPAAPARAAREQPGLFDALVGWAEEQLEPEPPPPDPGDDPVRCRIGSRERFSTRSDCEARRGIVFELSAPE